MKRKTAKENTSVEKLVKFAKFRNGSISNVGRHNRYLKTNTANENTSAGFGVVKCSETSIPEKLTLDKNISDKQLPENTSANATIENETEQIKPSINSGIQHAEQVIDMDQYYHKIQLFGHIFRQHLHINSSRIHLKTF